MPEAEITQKNITALTDDQRTPYEIIAEVAGIVPDGLYDRYDEQSDDPKTEYLVRYCITKLADNGLIETVGMTADAGEDR